MVTLAPGGLDFGTGSVPRLAPGPSNPHLPEALPIMKFSHPGRLAGLCTTLFLLLAVTPVQATQLVQQNLTQLISAAETIISGRVTKVTDGFTQNGIPYTEVTIAVSGAAKGADADLATYTFRQFGLLAPRTLADGTRYLGLSPEGFARWQEDEIVIAFLHRPASMTGLQTTAGLAQGKFALREGKYVNQFENRGLFDGVEVDVKDLTDAQHNILTHGGPADAGAFMELIRRAVAEKWIEQGEMR